MMLAANSRLVLAALSLAMASTAAAAPPSFLGAEGFGAVTPGGRGGQVLHVTNLDDDGPGSFRAALTASGPRTVVFDVSGTINLATEVSVVDPYLTIAGQTAPGMGVTIAGETVSLDTHDVIVRHLRFRRGTTTRADDALGSDRTNSNNLSNPKTGNIIIDHVSASWGLDENLSVYRSKLDAPLMPGGSTVLPSRNVTVQWSISSEALNPNRHAFGSTLGGAGVNFHHNLWASNTGRNPSISFSDFMDFRNNVLFNWMHRSVDGAGPEAHVNVINNYYKPGPATGFSNSVTPQPTPEIKVLIVEPELRSGPPYTPATIGDWYVNGNFVDGSVVGQDFSAVSADNWEGVSEVAPGEFATGVQFENPYPVAWARVNAPITHVERPDDPDDPFDDDGSIALGRGNPLPIPDLPTIATQSAHEAFQAVLAGAGASLARDAVDLRVVDSAASGVATAGPRGDGIINSAADVGGYPAIPFVERGAEWDADQDGMPGVWEAEHGLNPADPADRNGDFDADGFTNLDDYLNEVGAFPAVEPIVWNGTSNNRYAQIENWNIAFQPSALDTAVINLGAVVVDAVGQHAGMLVLGAGPADAPELHIESGRLAVNDELVIGADASAAAALRLTGGELRVGRLSKGAAGDFEFTGGVLAAEEVAFDVVNDGGVIAPGVNRKTAFLGDLEIAGGVIRLDVAGAGVGLYDKVDVAGVLAAGGVLELDLVDGFAPGAGDAFDVLDFASISGEFTLDLPALEDGLGWDATDLLTTGVLAVAPASDADFDGDGDVDGADFLTWQRGVGLTDQLTNANGDATGDGTVDGLDLAAWQAQFSSDEATAAADRVPEPAAGLLALLPAICSRHAPRAVRLQHRQR